MEKKSNKFYKVCFRCDKYIKDEDEKIRINSITDQSIKRNIEQKLREFKPLVGKNIDIYDTKFIHFSCYKKLEKKLN